LLRAERYSQENGQENDPTCYDSHSGIILCDVHTMHCRG
jgi:hypothetical protein